MMTRRHVLRGLAAAGGAGLLGMSTRLAAAGPPPETTRLRIAQIASTCRSPEWMAEELLRVEGLTDVQYLAVPGTLGVERGLASGEADISGHFAAPVILRIEAGDPIVILAGEHVGCFELLGTDRIRTVARGLSTSAASWSAAGSSSASTRSRPSARSALLKAADLCALQPDRAARSVVDKGYERRPNYALQVMKDIPYGKWREYEPEDTVRFYALRLHEAGLIKSSPQKIIAQNTDWRFLREFKKELKA